MTFGIRAVIAFSAFHRHYEANGKGNIPSDVGHEANEIQRHGLAQYNIAVRQAVQLLDIKDPSCYSIALISCMLFVCLELIQDNYAAAIKHLTGGLQLLCFCENAHRDKPPLPSLSDLTNKLKQTFGRIIVQSMFLGDTHYDVSVIPRLFELELPPLFSSVAEARDALDRLFLLSYHFLRQVSTGVGSDYDNLKLHQMRRLNRLQEWYHIFQELTRDKREEFNVKDSTGVILLEIHYASLLIMLDTALDQSKAFWGVPTSPFLRILDLVESLLSQQDPPEPTINGATASRLPRYSFDLGVIGPLFYTAVKCWNPFIRSKAISLLRHPDIPHREGMWSAEAAATLAQGITDVEEDLVSSAVNLGVNAEASKVDEEVKAETVKKKIWFDIDRPTEDEKKLKIFVGAKPDMKRDERERREEFVSW
ncbi:hypothetical protein F5884DRAFT_749224 [Xylogone sp. PMI_703]|nr:hypothetical protein F5884DRAFT_749224 [Xylogone sp. PMI_703]